MISRLNSIEVKYYRGQIITTGTFIKSRHASFCLNRFSGYNYFLTRPSIFEKAQNNSAAILRRIAAHFLREL